ncbi:MAG: S1 RNA-binding domain-containing protein [Gemmatimonadetes bacterium]|nr:S1 RNA-binding domain-containing protein [Gemmatimonadota bacterium]
MDRTPADDMPNLPETPEATNETVAEASSPEEAVSPATTEDSGVVDAATSAAATAAVDAAGVPSDSPKPGARLKGRIVKIDEQSAFVDFGGREEAVLDVREIKDPEGKLTRKVGDELQVTVRSAQDGVKVTIKSGKGTPANLPQLLEAANTGVAVEGKVTGVNKGGLVVNVMGVRAFCPFSQIDRHYVEDPSVFLNKKLEFRVSSADPKGRNVVLSRRVILEEEAKSKAQDLRRDLQIGSIVKGVVARIRPFGAFVDLGGVDGLIHVSEISHARVKDPSEVLKVGQEVEVKVRSIEDLGGPKERVSLSLKDLAPDPWDTFVSGLEIGSRVTAKVARVTDFGAFMELTPGIDGLAHVSTLAPGRVNHPSDVVEVGQEHEVWIVSVDRDKHRISLSLIEPGSSTSQGGGHHDAPEFDPSDYSDFGGGRDFGGGGGRGGRGGGRHRKGGGRRDSRRNPDLDEYHAKSRRQQESGPTAMAQALRRAGLAEDED